MNYSSELQTCYENNQKEFQSFKKKVTKRQLKYSAANPKLIKRLEKIHSKQVTNFGEQYINFIYQHKYSVCDICDTYDNCQITCLPNLQYTELKMCNKCMQ